VFLECIIPSKDGGFVISGSSNSNISGDKTENNWDTTLATRDYWVMKIDSIGNIVWQNTIGGTMEDFTASINATTDGGYIIGGTSKSDSSGDKTENGCNTFNGSWDYWVVKIDSIGNILWQNTITANFTDRMYGISQTTDGGFICGGTSHSNISCDKIENNLDYPHNSTSDYWVVKLDSIGNILWQNTIGGGQWCSDHLSSIELTKDGGYICGGSSDGTWAGNDKSEMTKGGYDYWVVKLDSVGNVEWENTIGGASVDYLYSVKQLIDGSYICGGTSKSNVSSDKANPSIGGYDYWIVKLDAFGDIVWQKTIGGNSDDDLDYITPTIDNGFICGGASISSISGLKTEVNLGSGDNWIIKLDSNGNIQWQNTIGGSGNDGLARVFPSYDGNSIICGATSNSGISGDKTENSKGGYDFWIYKINDIEYGSLITGNAFVDNNANSIQDSSENNLQYKRIDLLSHNLWTYTAANGFYNLPVPDSGNFTITPANVNYFTPNPNFHTATFTGTPKLDSLNDFPFQPIGIVNDLQIAVTPISAFRANSNCNYKLDYSNKGNTTLNASIIFYLGDTNYNYVSASVAPSLINSDSIVWNNITLTPWQQENIVVTVYVKNGVAIGTQIFSLCTINPIVGDSVPGDNYGSWKVITTGSFDPNNILVDEDTLITNQLADGASLNYIINFQNTGNDTAFYVKVLNPIDTNRFDLNTFEIVSSSHPFILNYIPWENNMEFKFENILLPDSNIDEANSHGYLCYRIKPKTTLPPNDSLTNFASIYFDSNSPIRTNNAVTRILPPNVYIHLYATVCDNYVSPSGKYTWANSGIYLDTIPVGIGLDSIFIVHLTLNKSFAVIDTNDCENYVSPSGNYLWTTSGIYSDTLINALGCDSIITIKLTINKSNSIINVTKCDSLTSQISNYVWTTSGTYFDTIPNAKGCDSLITINLTIQQPFQINSTILMCQGDSTFLSGSWQTIAGFYFDSLQS
ncbi:MAG TPA: hypothetical protein PK736_08290, partial [Bacteroidia bacterium]|nr:hypothetical protein [Bacteroidia bacterium]